MPAQANDKTEPMRNQARSPESANLDRRYGQIGIPAVAAALHYWTSAKKPASASASAHIDDRFIELVA
jgi:hypothetical protein